MIKNAFGSHVYLHILRPYLFGTTGGPVSFIAKRSLSPSPTLPKQAHQSVTFTSLLLRPLMEVESAEQPPLNGSRNRLDGFVRNPRV